MESVAYSESTHIMITRSRMPSNEESISNKRKFEMCDNNTTNNHTDTNSDRYEDDDNDDKDYHESEYDESEYDESEYDEEYDEDYDGDLESEILSALKFNRKNNNVVVVYNAGPSRSGAFERECEHHEEDEEEETCVLKKYASKLSVEERKYFATLSNEEKMRIVDTETIVSEKNRSTLPIRFKILSSEMDDVTKSIAIAKLDSIGKMDCSNGESTKIMNWITNLCNIPIGKYVTVPINNQSPVDEICSFLENTTANLNNNIYGHTSAKEQITRILAQWIANPGSKGNVIGIHGNPGVGKQL